MYKIHKYSLKIGAQVSVYFLVIFSQRDLTYTSICCVPNEFLHIYMCWRYCSDGWAASPEASGAMEQGWTHTVVRAPPGDIAAGGGTSLYNPAGGVWQRSRGHRPVSAMGQHYPPAWWQGAASWLKAQALQLRGALHPVLHPATQCHLWLCRRLLHPSSPVYLQVPIHWNCLPVETW